MATVEKMPMLAEGHEMLSAQLRDLKAERPKIVEAIEEARAHGDLSENAEYHAAKERQELRRAHVRTPVTNAHLVCRLLHEKKTIHTTNKTLHHTTSRT